MQIKQKVAQTAVAAGCLLNESIEAAFATQVDGFRVASSKQRMGVRIWGS